MKTCYMVSLGCARNRVDSEIMMNRLAKAGCRIVSDPDEADAIIINTCGFIESAIDESIDAILEHARFKKDRPRKLIVAGCLPQRFGVDILEALPEVDAFLGTGAFDRIVETVTGPAAKHPSCLLPDPEAATLDSPDEMPIRRASPFAYMKIAEGCSRTCTYCVIPRLRGKHRSRPLDDLEKEMRLLVAGGSREIALVAQDTTAYGKDLSPPTGLAELIRRLCRVSEAPWIRILYGHPTSFDADLLDAMRERRNLCRYLDIPIQHAADAVLRRMGRPYTRADLVKLFDAIRERVPEIALRTTVITGFPGETDEDVKTLLDFITQIRFNHLGVFTYSDADDLPSHRLSGHVPKKIAGKRRDLILGTQAAISYSLNRERVGQTYMALVDRRIDENTYAARIEFQAPEVDGITHIHSAKALAVGAWARIEITGAETYDLSGRWIGPGE